MVTARKLSTKRWIIYKSFNSQQDFIKLKGSGLNHTTIKTQIQFQLKPFISDQILERESVCVYLERESVYCEKRGVCVCFYKIKAMTILVVPVKRRWDPVWKSVYLDDVVKMGWHVENMVSCGRKCMKLFGVFLKWGSHVTWII